MSDFVKYHALGNDYLVVDPRRLDIARTGDTARLLCDRRYGVGADGLLVGPVGQVVPGEPVDLLIFNADGSPCGRSGNGIRIFASHLLDREPQLGRGPAGNQVTVRTRGGTSRVEIRDPGAGTVRIATDAPAFSVADPSATDPAARLLRPLVVGDRTLPVVALDDGNPHLVVPLPAVDRAVAGALGEPIAGHPEFPGRTNVEFLRVVDRSTIEIEVWERGAGYTTASGSGACAAAGAAHALGLVDDQVVVHMPGGTVEVGIDADGTVTLTGPVREVFAGELSGDLIARVTAEERETERIG
ncbi:diaminopimelate epimerase [Micromonospora sp. NPDC005172]|uniref:diaminopimelate epimerase n=1 Tax=Micromonospora sp. NPDC005172 TaxID=3156867 RepID=UPI0033A87FBC